MLRVSLRLSDWDCGRGEDEFLCWIVCRPGDWPWGDEVEGEDVRGTNECTADCCEATSPLVAMLRGLLLRVVPGILPNVERRLRAVSVWERGDEEKSEEDSSPTADRGVEKVDRGGLGDRELDEAETVGRTLLGSCMISISILLNGDGENSMVGWN